MNLLPIWHTSSNNYQKFKILKKRTDLRINGELITKSDIFKDSSGNNNTNNNNNNKTSPTNIIYNHIEQNHQYYDDYECYDSDYNDYYLKNKFFSTSLNAIGSANTRISTTASENNNNNNLQHIPSIETSIKNYHKNDKKYNLISISNNGEINNNISKLFFNNQNYLDHVNEHKYRYSKLSKLSRNKNNRVEHKSDYFGQELTAPTTLSSSSFANSYDSDMFRYQSWVMPEIKINQSKYNNNITNR